jgi:hypothetical protein
MEFLQSNTNEGWRGLASSRSVNDPQKFRAILKELNRLLEERDQQRRINLPNTDVRAKPLPLTRLL